MYNPNEIETIVTIQYRTPDGVVHETLAEALEHTPIYHPVYRMFASNKDDGVFETKDVEQAAFVYCPDNRSVANFANDCQSEGYTIDGIDGKGWYIWNSDNYAWALMPEGVISLFKELLA